MLCMYAMYVAQAAGYERYSAALPRHAAVAGCKNNPLLDRDNQYAFNGVFLSWDCKERKII